MRGHADAETLAAFREELLSRRKAGRVSAHLAACPRCAALDAQLAEVTAMLTRSTAPPMPDALTARIEAALAAEAAERSGARSVAGDRGPSRTRPGRPWPVLRVAAVTAAVAVIAGGGYGVAQLLSSGGPAETGASSGAASVPAAQPKNAGPRISASLRSGAASGGSANSARVISSGTDYRPGRLGAQASAVLAASGASTQPGPSQAAPQYQPSQFPGLQACVAHVAHGQHPLLVDVAKYRGHPAVIIVLPATPGAQPRAIVVAPGCTASTAHVLATAPLPATR